LKKLFIMILTVLAVIAMSALSLLTIDAYGRYNGIDKVLPNPYIVTSGGKQSDICINSAPTNTLKSLPYIGGLAADIVALREELGGFSSLEELMLIKGIGIKRYQNVRGMLTIN